MQLSNPLPGCDANSLRAKTKVKAVCTCISSCWNMCTAVSTCDASMQASTIACYSTACYQHYSYYRVLYRVSITLHCTCIQHPCHRDMKQQGCVPTSDGYTFHPHIIIVYYHAVIECIEYHTHSCHWDMEQQSYISTSDSFQGLTSGHLSPASCSLKMLHSLSSLIRCQVNNSRDSNSLTTTNAIVVLHQSTRRSTIVSFGLSQHDNFDSYNATNMLMTTEGF